MALLRVADIARRCQVVWARDMRVLGGSRVVAFDMGTLMSSFREDFPIHSHYNIQSRRLCISEAYLNNSPGLSLSDMPSRPQQFGYRHLEGTMFFWRGTLNNCNYEVSST
jgi:hypothetical protein